MHFVLKDRHTYNLQSRTKYRLVMRSDMTLWAKELRGHFINNELSCKCPRPPTFDHNTIPAAAVPVRNIAVSLYSVWGHVT